MRGQTPPIVNRPPDRRRLRDALAGRFTGEVPFFECWVAEEIVDQVMGRPMGTHMLRLPPADYVEFLQRTGMDAAYLAEPWLLGRRNQVDDRGRARYVDGTIKSRADFDQIVPPSLDPSRERIESVLDAARATDLGIAVAVQSSPVIANTAIGPTDWLIAMHDDPKFLHEFLDRVDEFALAQAECVLEYPVDVIWLTGPQCGKTGPIISLEMHEEFIFPRLQALLDIIKPAGIPTVLHTDGDNTLLMDWIITAGLSAIHPVEPCDGRFDIYALKEQYGAHLCLCGNVDVGSVLTWGTAEEVRADTLEHIRRLAPGGRYVCGSSHDITESIPFENFCALTQTVCSTTVRADGTLQTDS